jgi:hypothetical protein
VGLPLNRLALVAADRVISSAASGADDGVQEHLLPWDLPMPVLDFQNRPMRLIDPTAVNEPACEDWQRPKVTPNFFLMRHWWSPAGRVIVWRMTTLNGTEAT